MLEVITSTSGSIQTQSIKSISGRLVPSRNRSAQSRTRDRLPAAQRLQRTAEVLFPESLQQACRCLA